MNDLKKRTKQFAVDCWFLCNHIPNSREYNAYVNQLIRCYSSVGANYRASQRAKSTVDFINKLKIVEEEIDESMFFLEFSWKLGRIKMLNLLKNFIKKLMSYLQSSFPQ